MNDVSNIILTKTGGGDFLSLFMNNNAHIVNRFRVMLVHTEFYKKILDNLECIFEMMVITKIRICRKEKRENSMTCVKVKG